MTRATTVTLTASQLAVMRCFAHGKTAKQAGIELGISHRTVEIHSKGARERLRARTSTHAVVLSLHFGLITFGEAA